MSKFPSKVELLQQYRAQLKYREYAQRNSVRFLGQNVKLLSGLNLVGACTGQSKTTVGANILADFSHNHRGRRAVVVSNEEPLVDVYDRVSCLLLGLDFTARKEGKMSLQDKDAVCQQSEQLMDIIQVHGFDSNAEFDVTTLEGVKEVFNSIKQDTNVGLAMLDYLQTVETSVENEQLEAWQVSKLLGSYLREYTKKAIFPVVVFAQLYPNPTGTKDFSERIQNDKTILNHAVLAIEVQPDFANKTTICTIRKDRFQGLRERKYQFKYYLGLLTATEVESRF